MGFIDVKTEEFRVEWDRRHYTVISPRKPLNRLFVTAHAQANWQIWADREGFADLANWMMLVANFPHVIVHIPRSSNRISFLPESQPHDLVLTGHQCQLRASKWREIRDHLGKRLLSTRSIARPDPDAPMLPKFSFRPVEDPVDVKEHSRTVFIISSKPAFQHMSGLCEALKSCVATGDHQHLFGLMRGGGKSVEDDLTFAFAEANAWATS